MSKKHLSPRPHNIKPGSWWYEENSGIEVVHQIRDDYGKYIRTDHIRIPWVSIRAALKRKDKK